MENIANELALADSPASTDDLVLYVLAGLNTEFKEAIAAICVRDTPIFFEELHDKLCDFELQIKKMKLLKN